MTDYENALALLRKTLSVLRDCGSEYSAALHCAADVDAFLSRAQTPLQESVADVQRAELLGRSLRQRAHELRREACAAWSAVIGTGDIDQVKCDYAAAIEARLKAIIDELADLTAPQPAIPALDGTFIPHHVFRNLSYYSRQEIENALAAAPQPGAKDE